MHRSLYILLVLTAVNLLSCFSSGTTAVLWTDQSEFALYADYFNASQDQYKIEVQYFDFPGQKLTGNGTGQRGPDIVAGSWLKSASTRVLFRTLDRHVRNNSLQRNAFYPRLLDMGNIDGRQYLLPVSFNAPVVIFNRDNQEYLSNPFTIGLDEMQALGANHNARTNGIYTRMGFSPGWDTNFLFTMAVLFGAAFSEGAPSGNGVMLTWDYAALEKAMQYAYEWTHEANTSIQAVEDFTFRYLYDSPAQLVISGRILFTFMNSDRFFIMTHNNLGFRWIAEQETIPITEQSVYLGLTRKGNGRRARRAAEAFLHWFYSIDTQRSILEKNHQTRMSETSFGISGGFSALRTVTEQVFPQFYPDLLGHMPPHDFLYPANILPGNWMAMKEQVILPYLGDRARQDEGIPSLERRLADWQRVN